MEKVQSFWRVYVGPEFQGPSAKYAYDPLDRICRDEAMIGSEHQGTSCACHHQAPNLPGALSRPPIVLYCQHHATRDGYRRRSNHRTGWRKVVDQQRERARDQNDSTVPKQAPYPGGQESRTSGAEENSCRNGAEARET